MRANVVRRHQLLYHGTCGRLVMAIRFCKDVFHVAQNGRFTCSQRIGSRSLWRELSVTKSLLAWHASWRRVFASDVVEWCELSLGLCPRREVPGRRRLLLNRGHVRESSCMWPLTTNNRARDKKLSILKDRLIQVSQQFAVFISLEFGPHYIHRHLANLETIDFRLLAPWHQ